MTAAPRPAARRRLSPDRPKTFPQQPVARRRLSPDRPKAFPQQPVALLYGPGLRIVHGNPAFVAEFGAVAVGLVGLPAREVLVGLPALAFEVVDRVRSSGRPLACWLEVAGERRRLTVAPRIDPETGEVYGVAIRLAHAQEAPSA